MNHLQKVFTGIVLLITAWWLPQVWQVHKLYISSAARSSVQTSIEAQVAQKGWLRSGVSVKKITNDAVTLVYRNYKRGPDTTECVHVQFSNNSAAPC